MNKTPVLASSLPNRALLKRIASLLSGHVSMHLPQADSRHIPANPDADRIVPYTANFGGVKNGRAYSFRRAGRILTNSAIQIILRWYERYQKELAVRQP